MNELRHWANLVEARMEDPNVSYREEPTKVTAQLSSHISGKYTNLMRSMQRVDVLTEEIKQLNVEIKQQRRDDVDALFDADDAVFTRVVETKSVIFSLTKDPKVTEAPKYKLILDELEKHLTPELIKVLSALKKEHVTLTQKAPALSYKEIDEDSESENTSDVLARKVFRWAPKFDAKLDAIKRELEI